MALTETYALDFDCLNCGHRFTEEIPKGHIVKYRYTKGRDTISMPEGAMKLRQIQEIECPNCGSTTKTKPDRAEGMDRKNGDSN